MAGPGAVLVIAPSGADGLAAELLAELRDLGVPVSSVTYDGVCVDPRGIALLRDASGALAIVCIRPDRASLDLWLVARDGSLGRADSLAAPPLGAERSRMSALAVRAAEALRARWSPDARWTAPLPPAGGAAAAASAPAAPAPPPAAPPAAPGAAPAPVVTAPALGRAAAAGERPWLVLSLRTGLLANVSQGYPWALGLVGARAAFTFAAWGAVAVSLLGSPLRTLVLGGAPGRARSLIATGGLRLGHAFGRAELSAEAGALWASGWLSAFGATSRFDFLGVYVGGGLAVDAGRSVSLHVDLQLLLPLTGNASQDFGVGGLLLGTGVAVAF